jgi:hypothetical protein
MHLGRQFFESRKVTEEIQSSFSRQWIKIENWSMEENYSTSIVECNGMWNLYHSLCSFASIFKESSWVPTATPPLPLLPENEFGMKSSSNVISEADPSDRTSRCRKMSYCEEAFGARVHICRERKKRRVNDIEEKRKQFPGNLVTYFEK